MDEYTAEQKFGYDFNESDDVMNIDDYVDRQGDNTSSDNTEDNSDDSQKVTITDDEPEEYKVKSLSNNFLRCECQIKLEENKTVLKFSYRDKFYKGVVLQQWLNKKDEYLFDVVECDKNYKPLTKQRTPKKICIPEVRLAL